MRKTLSALALAAVVALAGLAPTPAAAENRNMRNLVLGAGALALTALAVKQYRDRKEEDEKRREKKKEAAPRVVAAPTARDLPTRYRNGWPVYPQGDLPRATIDPRDPPRILVDPYAGGRGYGERPGANLYPGHIEQRYSLPKSCQRSFSTSDGKRSVLQESCLRQAGIRAADLPSECRRIVDFPGENRDRAGYSRSCMLKAGYRIE